MVDAGGPGNVVRKCYETALGDLGDIEGFDRDGKDDRLYAFHLSQGVYKRKEVILGGVMKYVELSDIETSNGFIR